MSLHRYGTAFTVAWAILSGTALAATIQVPGQVATIQAAVDAASDGDTVLVADGQYAGSGNREINLRGLRIVLRSAGGATNTVINCGGTKAQPHRGFILYSAETSATRIEGFTVTGGYYRDGGAVYLSGSSPTFSQCVFRGDTAMADGITMTRGGAVRCVNASPTFAECTFTGNAAGYGGAVSLDAVSEPVFDLCVFSANSAKRGGAVYSGGGKAVFQFSVFSANVASELGGGLGLESDSSVFLNCTFVANRAEGEDLATGGAVWLKGNNTGSFENVLIADNFSATGTAVACYDGLTQVPNITCSNMYNNIGGDWAGCLTALGTDASNLSAAPLFCDAAGGSYNLTESSPCAPANNSCGTLIGALEVGCVTTDVDDYQFGELPDGFALQQNYPNPFNPTTIIEYTLPRRLHVRVDVFNLLGERVVTLENAERSAGTYQLEWDGRDAIGSAVASGIYFYRLNLGDQQASRKMILLR